MTLFQEQDQMSLAQCSMTARKGDIRPSMTTGDYTRPYKAIQGHTRPYKAIQCHIRPQTAIQYHNVPQKITICPHCFLLNFIFTQRNIFCSPEHFLFQCTFFAPLHILYSLAHFFPCTLVFPFGTFFTHVSTKRTRRRTTTTKLP